MARAAMTAASIAVYMVKATAIIPVSECLRGRTSAAYSSNDMQGADSVSYDSDTGYYAAYIGAGLQKQLSERTTIDMYGKYFYNHQNSSKADLSSGETYSFDSIDSSRIRVGARVANQYAPASSTYYGAAYEYEFGGDAKASYKGMETPSPSLKGGSGMLELGWITKPSETSPMTVDLSLNGWTGKKQGWNLNANLTWKL